MHLNYKLIINKCAKMVFELWACLNGKILILLQNQIYKNLVWQHNFWSTIDFSTFVRRFLKWNKIISKSIREALRSYSLRPTSNFCQSALLWPSKSTCRSNGCGLLWCCVAGKKSVLFWPSKMQWFLNSHPFDLRMRVYVD